MALLALVASPVSVLAEEPKVSGAPVALNDGWSLAAQAEVGLDAARLCELDSFVAQWPDANIHAVVVVRNGKLAMERYFSGEDERWGDKLGRVTYGPEGKHDQAAGQDEAAPPQANARHDRSPCESAAD